MSNINENFVFRSINADEVDQAVIIEHICFPPNEACSEKCIKERVKKAPERFLVAIDKKTDKLAGFLNGLATNEKVFRDDFFLDAELYEPNGKYIMLLGLDVLPEYRGQGLGRELVNQYSIIEKALGTKRLVLTCLEEKVEMYLKFGFTDNGIANSAWGGEQWHEMYIDV